MGFLKSVNQKLRVFRETTTQKIQEAQPLLQQGAEIIDNFNNTLAYDQPTHAKNKNQEVQVMPRKQTEYEQPTIKPRLIRERIIEF